MIFIIVIRFYCNIRLLNIRSLLSWYRMVLFVVGAQFEQGLLGFPVDEPVPSKALKLI